MNIARSFSLICGAVLAFIGTAVHGTDTPPSEITGFSMGAGHMVRFENYSFYLRLDKNDKVRMDANCWLPNPGAKGDMEQIEFQNCEVDRADWDAFLKLAEKHNLRNGPPPPKPSPAWLDVKDESNYSMELRFADKSQKKIKLSEETHTIFRAFMEKTALKYAQPADKKPALR